MRARVTRAAVAVVAVAAVVAPASVANAPRGRVAVFYYPWYGTPGVDGRWRHWQQNASPPDLIASNYFPARGIYSSADRRVVAAQMREIASAGVNEVVVSWWGRGSPEDDRIGLVAALARARHLD